MEKLRVMHASKFIFASLLLSVSTSHAFSDVTISDPLYPSTTYLEQIQVFKGYEDGSFGKEKIINRAESLKTILVAAEHEVPEKMDSLFADVPADIWFGPYVNYAAQESIVSGDATTGEFAPARTVNKVEFLKMLMKAFEVDPTAFTIEASAPDVEEGAWFAPYINFAIQFGVITLDENGNANPGAELTRGDAADLIFNMMYAGKGLDPQILLNLSEAHLIKSVEYIEQDDIPVSVVLVSIAERYALFALEILPENTVVQSANRVVAALKNIVSAYLAGENGSTEDVLAETKKAWTMADESYQMNPGNEDLANKIKTIASEIANKAREAQNLNTDPDSSE